MSPAQLSYDGWLSGDAGSFVLSPIRKAHEIEQASGAAIPRHSQQTCRVPVLGSVSPAVTSGSTTLIRYVTSQTYLGASGSFTELSVAKARSAANSVAAGSETEEPRRLARLKRTGAGGSIFGMPDEIIDEFLATRDGSFVERLTRQRSGTISSKL